MIHTLQKKIQDPRQQEALPGDVSYLNKQEVKKHVNIYILQNYYTYVHNNFLTENEEEAEEREEIAMEESDLTGERAEGRSNSGGHGRGGREVLEVGGGPDAVEVEQEIVAEVVEQGGGVDEGDGEGGEEEGHLL